MNKTEIIVYARERHRPDVSDRLTEIEYDIEAGDTAATRAYAMTVLRRLPAVLGGENVLIEPKNQGVDGTLSAAGYGTDTSPSVPAVFKGRGHQR